MPPRPQQNPPATPPVAAPGGNAQPKAQDPPKLTMELTPKVTEFAITTAPAMPSIQVRCAITGITPDPTFTTAFDWTAEVAFTPTDCTNGVGTAPPKLQASGRSTGGNFPIAFTELRGGKLTIKVSATIGTQKFEVERHDLKIVGTNPLYTELTAAIDSKVFRALTWHESRGRQFLGSANGGTSACPLFSGDKLGGVGLTQLTRPAPTLEQTWNWRENIEGGKALFEDKKRAARAWANGYSTSAPFKALVDAYNAERTKAKQTAVTITIPALTDDQIELDALRGYNGWAGGVHEFTAETDADGKLQVTLNADGATGAARWIQVSAAARTAAYDKANIPANRRGDVDYVNHIMDATVPY